MPLHAAVTHNCLCTGTQEGLKEGSRAGEKSAEGKEEGKKKVYTYDKHAICCKMLCVDSSLVCP